MIEWKSVEFILTRQKGKLINPIKWEIENVKWADIYQFFNFVYNEIEQQRNIEEQTNDNNWK